MIHLINDSKARQAYTRFIKRNVRYKIKMKKRLASVKAIQMMLFLSSG